MPDAYVIIVWFVIWNLWKSTYFYTFIL